MAIADDIAIDSAGDIYYKGTVHGEDSAGYYTVIQFHRFLQDLADNASVPSGADDLIDITSLTPSDRSTDNIITVNSGYTIDDDGTNGSATESITEHLYDGSIIMNDGTIYDGLVVLGAEGMDLQIMQDGDVLTNDFWNNVPHESDVVNNTSRVDSTANASGTNSAAQADLVTTDGTQFSVGDFIMAPATTNGDQEEYRVKSISTNTLTLNRNLVDAISSNEDIYITKKGLNRDVANGISHRFILKVNAAGTATDNQKIIGLTRTPGKTYSEFKINSTANGNNVLALTYADDLNDAEWNLASTYNSVNDIYGYNAIDMDNSSVDEYYYSSWDLTGDTSKQFYQKTKWLTACESVTTNTTSNSTTMYGIDGNIFRGITHELTGTQSSGTFGTANTNDDYTAGGQPETVTWTGGSGQMLASDHVTSATALWIQVLTGSAPTTGNVTGSSSGAIFAVSGASDRTVSTPFSGSSTGSAMIGAYGLAIEYVDATQNDLFTALDGSTYQPPNNVTFTVGGVTHVEDRILVGPEDGAGGLDTDQRTLNTTLSTSDESSVVVTVAIPADTPASGTIRVELDEGVYKRVRYSSFTGSTFTIQADDTFVDGDVTVGSDTVTLTTHGFLTGDHVQLSNSGGTLPAGLSAATDYYIIKVDANTVSFATTLVNAHRGIVVDITAAAGAGTHTVESMSRNFGGTGEMDSSTAPKNVFISYLDTLAEGTVITDTADCLTAGVEYEVRSQGDSDWTAEAGAANNTVGTRFTALDAAGGFSDGQGTTGTVSQVSTSESFSYVYDSADRDVFIRVRDGGTEGDDAGIKTFETTGTVGTGGGSTTAIRTSDV